MNIVHFILLLLFINNIKYIVGKTVYFNAFQFKYGLNPDFGMPYIGTISVLGTNPVLDDRLPKYCCGDNPTTKQGVIIVHNSSTFDQWWVSNLKSNYYYPALNDRFDCGNYGFNLKATASDEYGFGYISTITISQQDIIESLNGIGFNNATAYPEYVDDTPGEKELFCFSFIVQILDNLGLSDPFEVELDGAEFILAHNDAVVFENIGALTSSKTITLAQNSDPFSGEISVFSCIRDPSVVRDITIRFKGFSVECNINYVDCGTCGSIIGSQCKPQCPYEPNPTKEAFTAFGCGICSTFITNCEDNDPCTIETFIEGEGCFYENICEITTSETTTQSSTIIDITTIASTILSTISETTIDISTIATTTHTTTSEITTQSSSIDVTTTGSTIFSTISETTIDISTIATTTYTTTSEITSESSTIDFTTTGSTIFSTISDSTTSSSSSSSNSITTNKPPQFNLCDSSSCLDHYYCIQLSTHSYTCISKYFDQNCSPDRLKSFY